MDITYIEHSSFAVETEKKILLFDYYKGEMPQFDNAKDIFVFASHVHEDHFSFKIFDLAKKYDKVTYILSKDIRKKYNKKYFEKQGVSGELFDEIVFINANEKKEVQGITVETLLSNDCGVAFMVYFDGKSIYHSGDLNDWVWRGEPEDFNTAITAAYKKEIDKIKGRHFDAAFGVVDPRQGEDFYRGAEYLFENITADVFLPMHFWGDSTVADSLREHISAKKFKNCIVNGEIYTKEPYKITI